MELLRITRQMHCKAVEQRATLIHRQYNRDWGTSYSTDPYLTSPLLENPGGTTGTTQRWVSQSVVGGDDFAGVRVGRMLARVRLVGDHHHVGGGADFAPDARQRDARVVVGVDRLAEVDRVLELLPQHVATRVARHLQQEEARVRLGQELVRRTVLVQHLAFSTSRQRTDYL